MPGIDLSVGGWDGWYFGSYGRAKAWRLLAPDGQHFQPGEVLSIRELILDKDYLSMRVNQLKAIARPALSADDYRSLSCAVATLQDFLSVFASLGGYPVNVNRRTRPTVNPVENEHSIGHEGRYHTVAVPSARMNEWPDAQLGAGELVGNVE